MADAQHSQAMSEPTSERPTARAPGPPPTLVFVFGPPAVGKMTFGQALADLTGLKLLHNHLTIELLLPFFAYGSPPFTRLNWEFRTRILEENAASSLPGLIVTCVWDFDEPQDRARMDAHAAIFRRVGGAVYYVELAATLAVRLERNHTTERRASKPSKADVTASEARLLRNEQLHRMNSQGDFPYPAQHLKLQTDEQDPLAVAPRFGTALGCNRRSSAHEDYRSVPSW